MYNDTITNIIYRFLNQEPHRELMVKYLKLLFLGVLITTSAVASDDTLMVKAATKEIIITGFTRTIQTQIISSEVPGKVLSVHYDRGDTISKKSFIKIDPTFINFQIQNTTESMERLNIAIRKARSRVSYFEKESERIRELHRQDLATESQKDSIVQNFDQAGLELESSLRERAALKNRLGELIERRKRHRIYAPEGWIVTDRSVEENEIVQPGLPLAKVSDYREMAVPLSVSSEELMAIQALPNIFPVQLESDSPGASINWINPEFNEKSRKLNIELIIKDYEGPRRGGLKVSFPVKVKTEGIHIPEAAVSRRYENSIVTLKGSGEVVQLLILGNEGGYFLAAEDDRLTPGTELIPAGNTQQKGALQFRNDVYDGIR